MLKLLTIAACLALTACAANLPVDPSKMSAEQLKAMKEASAVAQCTTGAGPWGRVQTTFISLDKASIPSGSISVDGDCKVTITADPKVKP